MKNPRSDVAQVEFTAGPRSGERVALTELEVVIGRSNEVTLPVPDTSVSRRHLSLRRAAEGWLVKDLGSGNGTLVNGEQIAEEMPIHHGDFVVLGETEFTFLDDSNVTGKVSVPAPRPRATASGEAPVRRAVSRPTTSRSQQAAVVDPGAQKKKRLMMIGAAGVMVLLVGGVVTAKVVQNKQREAELRQRQEQAQAIASLEGQVQEARNLIRQAKWKEARTVLEQVNASAPNFQNVKDLISRAEVEIPNQEKLNAAEEAIGKGELATAKTSLDAVSSDTAMFEQVTKARRALQEKLQSRLLEANDRVREAKYAEALAIATDALAAFPEDRDAQNLIEMSNEGIEKGKVTPRVVTNTVSRTRPTDPAVAKFVDGDLTGAAAILNTCTDNRACKEMMKDLTEFGQLYKRLDSLDEKGLSRLLSLDKQITGGPLSKLARTAGSKAAGIYLRAAQSYKASGRWDKVLTYVNKALQANPSLTEAKKLEGELNKRAQETYEQGYFNKDGDVDLAMEKFREVLQMTSPDMELHGKAKNWLNKLGSR